MQRFCQVTRECPVKFPRREGHLFLPVEDGPARVGRSTMRAPRCEHKHNNENDRILKLPPGGACVVGAYAPAGLMAENFILSLPGTSKLDLSRLSAYYAVESMNVPNHLLLQVCGPDPTQAGRR
jgi:hypothetical protein